MATSAPPAVAGWYADPWGQAQSRYWDGAQWTAHVHPPAAPVAAPAYQVPQQAAPGYQAPQQAAPAYQVPQQAVPAQPAKQLPAPELRGQDEVFMSDGQRAYVATQLTTGGLFRRAWNLAAASPVIVGEIGARLIKIASYLPFGFFFVIWGLIGTFALIALTIVAVPLIAVLLLPVVMLAKRPKLNRDLASGSVTRHSGTFVVQKNKFGNGGILQTGQERILLSMQQLQALGAALSETPPFAFDGTILRTREAHLLLGAYDGSGRRLFGAA